MNRRMVLYTGRRRLIDKIFSENQLTIKITNFCQMFLCLCCGRHNDDDDNGDDNDDDDGSGVEAGDDDDDDDDSGSGDGDDDDNNYDDDDLNSRNGPDTSSDCEPEHFYETIPDIDMDPPQDDRSGFRNRSKGYLLFTLNLNQPRSEMKAIHHWRPQPLHSTRKRTKSQIPTGKMKMI